MNKYSDVIDPRVDVLCPYATRNAIFDLDHRLSALEARELHLADLRDKGRFATRAYVEALQKQAAPIPKQRDPGWYWVEWSPHLVWEPAFFGSDNSWWFNRTWVTSTPGKIGPRIQEPGE